MKHWLAAACLAMAGSAGPKLLAQQTPPPDVRKPFRFEDEGAPIRRAVPVERPIPRAVPLTPPTPVPPAVETLQPRTTPLPRATPKPVVKPKATPATSKAPPVPLPEPEDPGTIRIAPSVSGKTVDVQQLEIADSFYFKKMYDMAAPEYEKYLGVYPNAADRATALYRLGESYRNNGSLNAARNSYEAVLNQFRESIAAPAAAYRMAGILYGEKQFYEALPLYRKASVQLKEPLVANAAKFFTGRTLEALGQKTDARTAYDELVTITENNPFQDASRLSLALLLKDSGRTVDALKNIQLLQKQTENAELKAQATVRAGLWLLELNQAAKAEAELRKALEMPGIAAWKDVAQLGLLRMYFEGGKYQNVVDSYQEAGSQFAAENKAELTSLAADSYRQLGKHAEAQTLYEQILKDFPTTKFAADAQYERLKSLYYSESPNLIAELDKFLAANPEAQRRDQVLLMKGELLFKKQDFAGAAPIYAQLESSRQLTGTLKAEAIFKMGLCSMQLREIDRAVKAFTSFIESFPTHKLMPYALVQRAVAHQQQKNFTAATKDYSELITKFPKAPEREFALLQKALMLGQQNNNQEMADTFERLLKDFPETEARSKAHYWIGRVAYDTKNYKKAATHLEQARSLDKTQFFEKASLLILLSHYYLEDDAAAAREVDIYAKEGKTRVPSEVLRWLGAKMSAPEKGDHQQAEKYLKLLVSSEETTAEDLLNLGLSQVKIAKHKEAVETFQKYLKVVKDPEPRATGLLQLTSAQIGLGALDDAQKSVDETLTIQPEGKLNGEARIAAGDVQMARTAFEQAAKLYASVSLLLDDEVVTPRALEKAYHAYKKAGLEAEAKKTMNTLQSRYPEYLQKTAKVP